MQTEFLYQSLFCFYEYFITLSSVSVPLEPSTTTADRHAETFWKSELSILIPTVRSCCQCINQILLRLFLSFGIVSIRTLWSARVYSTYQRVCQLKVLVIIKKESNNDPKQACVATNLTQDLVDASYCPFTSHGWSILYKLPFKSFSIMIFLVSYIEVFWTIRCEMWSKTVIKQI